MGEPKNWGEVGRGGEGSFAVFLPFTSVWKRKGNGCYTGKHSSFSYHIPVHTLRAESPLIVLDKETLLAGQPGHDSLAI